jgi:hypothetical protein
MSAGLVENRQKRRENGGRDRGDEAEALESLHGLYMSKNRTIRVNLIVLAKGTSDVES